jgi:hypothetical protein
MSDLTPPITGQTKVPVNAMFLTQGRTGQKNPHEEAANKPFRGRHHNSNDWVRHIFAFRE